jgi:hypothetical protein
VDHLLPPSQHVIRSDVIRGAIQADVVVSVHVRQISWNNKRVARTSEYSRFFDPWRVAVLVLAAPLTS